MRSFSISHKGQAKAFVLAETTTLGELRDMVADAFGVEPQNQKMLLKGGNFAHDTTAIEEAISENARIVLVGTATRDLEAFKASTAKREEGRANRNLYMAKGASSIYRTRATQIGSDHGFQEFETLPDFPDKERALKMLHKLANDEGVKQVMKKHEYLVGTLRELHPFERTILGYNRNRGQVIALRLRTDSLDGFRDYMEVRRVLMHELAHMVWDEHDTNFRALNSQHCREVVELDWTRRGQTVGPAGASYYEPQDESEAQSVDGGALGATGFVLGGEAPLLPPGDSDNSTDAAARRELIYKAAQKRMDKRT
ncbi:hypothetical protein IW140_003150 [Coemansia sp. RSA 1813]|nr:hypothetical protein LPJ74_000009 [Coemansia sp. RSA 1843]KAJ2089368.1 hypothetical protein IW138_003536 [Coemansia sp. RSA 986]KAJ2214473.1 hypothetical protein EV179_003016 [Coemansia sp. RSA 487]KAJ2569305.1 hypothetical protein IW140_003150 [Coemansia sp. RSA 1813]